MNHLIFWRLVQLPLILGVIFLVTFLLVWITPGNPLAAGPEGQQALENIEAARLRQYNLHSPFAFARSYLVNLLTRGDFGPSLQYGDWSVNDILADGLPVSASLGVLALIVALLLGSVAGILGALRPGSLLDFSSLAIALIGISLPAFVTGSILLVGFVAIVLALPPYALGPMEDVMLRWVLPALTLGVAPAAYIARLVRLGLADVMSADFIRTARAKGLSQHQALFRHALKVAYLPVLSFLGPAAAATMTGSFVVEEVFNIAGLGEHFVNAVRNKDQFLLLGVVLVYSVMLVLFNLAVDVAYAWIDPRIEL